jgi:Family of unknown function (DUF6496)
MPEEEVIRRAEEDKQEGKSASTQAGEFVREEMHHVREGKHGARSPQQAIAIGLSKARRAGVKLPAPKRGTSARTREQAKRDTRKGRQGRGRKTSRRRSRAVSGVLRREGHSATSRASLSRHARSVARRRGRRSRQQSALKAARTRNRERRNRAPGRSSVRRAGRRAPRTRK